MYAHTDSPDERAIIAVTSGGGDSSYMEWWSWMIEAEMPGVAAMAERQRDRFKGEATALERRIQVR